MSKKNLPEIAKSNREKVRAASPIHADVLEMFKEQLLIVLLRRLGADEHVVKIPVSEVDDTGRVNLSFSAIEGEFNFVLTRKPS